MLSKNLAVLYFSLLPLEFHFAVTVVRLGVLQKVKLAGHKDAAFHFKGKLIKCLSTTTVCKCVYAFPWLMESTVNGEGRAKEIAVVPIAYHLLCVCDLS